MKKRGSEERDGESKIKHVYLLPLREKGSANEKLVKGLDRQIKTMLKGIEQYYADGKFVRDFARLIKTNEDILTKDQIFR